MENPEQNVETVGDGGSDAVDGLFLGGTAVTVEAFDDGDYFDHRLEDLLVDSFHVEYANEQGLRQLAEKAEAIEESLAACDALGDFFAALHAEDEPVAYGPEKTDRALEFDAVETLLVSERRSIESLRERVQGEGGDCVMVPMGIDRGERFAEAFGGIAGCCGSRSSERSVLQTEHAVEFGLDLLDVAVEHLLEFLVVDQDTRHALAGVLR